MKVSNKVLDKVRKLLAKANDPGVTQEEMEAFLAAAQRLSIKHNIETSSIELDMSDIGQDKIDVNRCKKEDKNFEGNLLEVVVKQFNCKVIWSTRRGKIYSYKILGSHENRQMAIEMFKVCIEKFRSYAWPRYKEYQKEGIAKWRVELGEPKIGAYKLIDMGLMINSETFVPSYLNGCIAGLELKFKEEKEAELQSDEAKEKWGLIVVKHNTLVDEYQAKAFKNVTPIDTEKKLKKASAGFKKGVEDGKSQTNSKELNQ